MKACENGISASSNLYSRLPRNPIGRNGEKDSNGRIQKLMLFLASGRCYVSYTRIKTNDPSVELMVNSWLGVDRGRDAVIG